MDGLLSLALFGVVVLGAAGCLAAFAPRSGPGAWVGVLFALGLIALLTLSPTGSLTASVNLDPGAGLAPPWQSATSAVNVLGNLLLFVPLGVTLPAAARPLRSPFLLVPVAAAVSAAVELMQYAYIPGRASDINDILLNTAGALAGLVALRAVRMVTDRTLAYA